MARLSIGILDRTPLVITIMQTLDGYRSTHSDLRQMIDNLSATLTIEAEK